MATATDKALAKREELGVTTYEVPEGGWEDDGTGGITPQFPTIKIVQATSAMPGATTNAGAFFHSDTEEFSHNLDIVGLLTRETRAYFATGESTPACASPDAVAPLRGQRLWTDLDEDQPARCADCRFSEWGEDRTPPACRYSMVLLVDRAPEGDEPDLAQFRISGKSLKPFRQFVARKLAPKRKPLFTQALHFYTEEKSEPGKKWFELRIESKDLPPVEALAYNGILREQRERLVQGTTSTFDEPETPANPGWNDDGSNLDAMRARADKGEWAPEPAGEFED